MTDPAPRAEPADAAARAARPDVPSLPSTPAPRPRRRTVRRVPEAQLVAAPRTRPSAWTLYARWQWRRATRHP
ncbi:hypothetical protein [Actinomadura rifamycini]|uniref:hypothetical protein n=1 Tax=Actinomadura rifamycini TaxID=31962 RepID=UPI000411ACF0|nr:hypothetical protein [Actinomadura rifamycini]